MWISQHLADTLVRWFAGGTNYSTVAKEWIRKEEEGAFKVTVIGTLIQAGKSKINPFDALKKILSVTISR